MASKYYMAKMPEHYAIRHLDESSGTTIVDLELRRSKGDSGIYITLSEGHMQQIANFLNDRDDKLKKQQ